MAVVVDDNESRITLELRGYVIFRTVCPCPACYIKGWLSASTVELTIYELLIIKDLQHCCPLNLSSSLVALGDRHFPSPWLDAD